MLSLSAATLLGLQGLVYAGWAIALTRHADRAWLLADSVLIAFQDAVTVARAAKEVFGGHGRSASNVIVMIRQAC